MNRWSRFQHGRGGGVFKPRSVHSGAWARNVLATDLTLPRDEPYRWGLICAHSLHQRPDAQGLTNHFSTESDRALWQQGYDHALSLIARNGV